MKGSKDAASATLTFQFKRRHADYNLSKNSWTQVSQTFNFCTRMLTRKYFEAGANPNWALSSIDASHGALCPSLCNSIVGNGNLKTQLD